MIYINLIDNEKLKYFKIKIELYFLFARDILKILFRLIIFVTKSLK